MVSRDAYQKSSYLIAGSGVKLSKTRAIYEISLGKNVAIEMDLDATLTVGGCAIEMP